MFQTDYLEYFAPDFSLYPDIAARIENQNTKQVRVNRDARMRINLGQFFLLGYRKTDHKTIRNTWVQKRENS